MLVQAVEQQTPGHIRPFSPYRDFGQLATLIEIAFSDELALTGSQLVRNMRQMATLGPMLWVAGTIMPPMSGFVWIEEGQVVGNVSLTQEDSSPGLWTVSNVAVLPEYRGKGIAGQLLDTALAYVRQRGGRRLNLQVRSDNAVARGLYLHRSFSTYDAVHELNLPARRWPTPVGVIDVRVRSVRASDGPRLYDVVVASTPIEVLRQRPPRASEFRRGLWWQVRESWRVAFSGQMRIELVVEADEGIVAYGYMIARLYRGLHELSLYVQPDHRGHWELRLAESLLRAARGVPQDDLRAYISTSHPEAIQALHELGFVTLRVLDQMTLELA